MTEDAGGWPAQIHDTEGNAHMAPNVVTQTQDEIEGKTTTIVLIDVLVRDGSIPSTRRRGARARSDA